MATAAGTRRRLLVSGATIGFGFGAIVDVVIFHLILQTHHLLSGLYDPHTFEGLRTNVTFDGVFVLVMLGIVGVGFGSLWRLVNGTDRRFSTTYLVGAIVVGMGVFNVVDGVVSHFVLDLHDVAHGTGAWNPHWLVVSLILLGLGLAVLRAADGHATARR